MSVSPGDREALLAIAWGAIEAQVIGRRRPALPEPALSASGVFVTIHVDGELRGCLGTLDPREPVARAVSRLAADVTCMDTRFAPVREPEMARLDVQVSVLSTRHRVSDPSAIEVGRDGLVVELGYRRGLLLPQVAVEHGWDAHTFLAHACVKAGLPPDAWTAGAAVYRFEAEVFGAAPPSDRG
jgi:AmmeMemoRadiSam system protein A